MVLGAWEALDKGWRNLLYFWGQDQKEDGGGLPPHCRVDSRGQNPGLLLMGPASLKIYERISVILHSEAMVNFDATLKLRGE